MRRSIIQNNSQALIDQIQAEWDHIAKPFKEAEEQYKTDLEKLVLKYVSTAETLDQDCKESLEDLWIITLSDHPRDTLGFKDSLEHMLSMHINYLEYADE